MKIKKLKKELEITSIKYVLKNNPYFLIEIKILLSKELDINVLTNKSFVKLVAKKVQISELFNFSNLKFPLSIKTFDSYKSMYSYLLIDANRVNSNIVFINFKGVVTKINNLSLLKSTNAVTIFNSLDTVLNSGFMLLKILKVSI